MKKGSRLKVGEAQFLIILMLSSIICFLTSSPLSIANASSSSGTAKPMHFYFHYIDPPVYTAGSYSHYIMNTTMLFQAYNNSVYKPIGQPKMLVDLYLYPNLAGPVTINGTWQVFIWVNGSALKPCTWNIEFYERDAGGGIVWDSGLRTPTVTGGPTGSPGYLDVLIYCYNLSVPLSHTFSPCNTIEVEVTIIPSGAVACQIWYDSSSFPSKAVLPCQDYARPSSVKIYDANYTETSLFSAFWSESQRKVVVRANVTDPLGGYDIYVVNVTILNPASQPVLDNVNMTRISDGLWTIHYSNIYEANWSYPEAAMSGNYTVKVSVIDINGLYHYLSYLTYDPYVEYGYQLFSIGVQYPVQIKTIDSHNQTLVEARVDAVSQGVVLASGLTNNSGWWEAALWAGYYNMTIYWQGVEVAKELIQVTEPSNFTIQCRVYYPSFEFVDDVDSPLPGAQVYIQHPNGTINILPLYTTDSFINLTGAPAGNYSFTVLWKGVTVQVISKAVDSDGPYIIKCQVYELTVKVLGRDGGPVQGAYAVIYTQEGIVYDFKMTDASGQAIFKLPIGTYRAETHYSTVYWLTTITASATEPSISVTSSGPVTITLPDFPPSIWTTTGFLLLLTIIIIVAIGVVYSLHRKGLILT